MYREPRKTRLAITYSSSNGEQREIQDYVENFSYTDAEDSSDSISLTLTNIDFIWLKDWLPELGDRITATIYYSAEYDMEEAFDCGTFIVDDISCSGRPLVCNLNAISSPIDENFKSAKRTKNWEAVTLGQIAAEIAAAAGVQYVLDAKDIRIDKKSQDKQTDSAFLKSLCDDYGYTLKTYSTKIVITDPAEAEKRNPLADLSEESFSNWNYSARIGGTYTGARLTYTDSKGNVYGSTIGDITKRCLELNETCTSNENAYEIAKGKLNKENESAYTFRATLRAPMCIYSTCSLNVVEMPTIEGQYYLRQVQHNVSASGYVIDFEARKVVERIGTPTQTAVNYPVLQYGDKDATKDGYVSIMQAALVAKGYALPIFGVDGLFFSETRASVMACQAANGLTADGICAEQTWLVLI